MLTVILGDSDQKTRNAADLDRLAAGFKLWCLSTPDAASCFGSAVKGLKVVPSKCEHMWAGGTGRFPADSSPNSSVREEGWFAASAIPRMETLGSMAIMTVVYSSRGTT